MLYFVTAFTVYTLSFSPVRVEDNEANISFAC